MTAGSVATVVLLLAAVMTLALRASGQQVAVPFALKHQVAIIAVAINGRPAHMILDTGSERTAVSPKILNGVRVYRGGKALGVGGLRSTACAHIRIQFGGGTADHLVFVQDFRQFEKELGEEIDGLIGQDFLQDYRSVTIDFQKQVLTLEH